ncbi:MAG: hypothetical protein KAY82_05900 [Hylemonella sp.]|nr:hypothetical protein [Hylemonella sp.]
MITAYQLFRRIALACGVATGLGVLAAMAWASSDQPEAVVQVVSPEKH